jgi:hypothetical protein
MGELFGWEEGYSFTLGGGICCTSGVCVEGCVEGTKAERGIGCTGGTGGK